MTRRLIAPLTQGDVSGDCVLYSALNALRLLWPHEYEPLEECEALYAALVKAMGNQTDEMLVDGTEREVSRFVGRMVQQELDRRGLSLIVEDHPWPAPESAVDHIRTLRAFMRSTRLTTPTAVVIGLDEPWGHWTVIRAIGPGINPMITFHDSYRPDRLKCLRADRLTVWADEVARGKIMLDWRASLIYRRLDGGRI